VRRRTQSGPWILLGGPLLAMGLIVGTAPRDAAAQWVTAPGQGWVDATVFFQDTRETYQFDGVRRPIFADGRARTLSTFFTGAIGLRTGLDAWVQVPVHRLRFDDAADERVSTGLGDPRLFLRVDPTFFGGPSLPLAVRGGVKLDGGDFDVDAEIIPLGEGQRDWELLLEVGRSLAPRPIWVAGWVGHRWREANLVAARHPGNEWFWYASTGGELGPVVWQVGAEGIRGGPWVIQGIRLRSARREVIQVFPSVGTRMFGGELRAGVRGTLSGRNLPAGTAIFVSLFRPIALW
jgi:hypothetical protein